MNGSNKTDIYHSDYAHGNKTPTTDGDKYTTINDIK